MVSKPTTAQTSVAGEITQDNAKKFAIRIANGKALSLNKPTDFMWVGRALQFDLENGDLALEWYAKGIEATKEIKILKP